MGIDGPIYRRNVAHESAYLEPSAMPRAAGLSSGHVHVAAYRGSPIIGTLTYQDEGRAQEGEHRNASLLPSLAHLQPKQDMERTAFSRLPTNKTYFNTPLRQTDPLDPRYVLHGWGGADAAATQFDFQATQRIVGGKLVSSGSVSPSPFSTVRARPSAARHRAQPRGLLIDALDSTPCARVGS
jgi:hypothetical protein